MNNTARIISLLLALVICIGCLAACTPTTGGEGDNQIEETPQSDNYVANVQIKFATNDNKMKTAVDAMSSSAVINVFGENVSVTTSAKVNDNSTTSSYVLFDGMLYNSTSLSLGEHTVSESKKAEFAGESKESFIADVSSTVRIDAADFYVVDISKNGDKTSYACSDAFDEAKTDLAGLVADRFEAIGATVTVSNIEYQLETEGERNISSILSCDYVITINGESYEITMRLYTSYDYDAPVAVTAPENADSYVSVSYDEIVR